MNDPSTSSSGSLIAGRIDVAAVAAADAEFAVSIAGSVGPRGGFLFLFFSCLDCRGGEALTDVRVAVIELLASVVTEAAEDIMGDDQEEVLLLMSRLGAGESDDLGGLLEPREDATEIIGEVEPDLATDLAECEAGGAPLASECEATGTPITCLECGPLGGPTTVVGRSGDTAAAAACLLSPAGGGASVREAAEGAEAGGSDFLETTSWGGGFMSTSCSRRKARGGTRTVKVNLLALPGESQRGQLTSSPHMEVIPEKVPYIIELISDVYWVYLPPSWRSSGCPRIEIRTAGCVFLARLSPSLVTYLGLGRCCPDKI